MTHTIIAKQIELPCTLVGAKPLAYPVGFRFRTRSGTVQIHGILHYTEMQAGRCGLDQSGWQYLCRYTDGTHPDQYRGFFASEIAQCVEHYGEIDQ